jgi:hypothetical protein
MILGLSDLGNCLDLLPSPGVQMGFTVSRMMNIAMQHLEHDPESRFTIISLRKLR